MLHASIEIHLIDTCLLDRFERVVGLAGMHFEATGKGHAEQ